MDSQACHFFASSLLPSWCRDDVTHRVCAKSASHPLVLVWANGRFVRTVCYEVSMLYRLYPALFISPPFAGVICHYRVVWIIVAFALHYDNSVHVTTPYACIEFSFYFTFLKGIMRTLSDILTGQSSYTEVTSLPYRLWYMWCTVIYLYLLNNVFFLGTGK